MKRLFSILLFLWICIPVFGASTIITATITITNAPTTNGLTLTVNGDTRTWTNSVTLPSQILTNLTINGSATNMFLAISDSPFLNLSLAQLSNGITLQTITPNGPLTVSLGGSWATYTLATNTLTSAQVVRVPFTVETPTNQTNIATFIGQGMESATYGLSSTAPFMSNYVSLNQVQKITATKTLITPIEVNGTYTNPIITQPTLISGINYSNAFSSPGTNATSEQFGLGAATTGAQSAALGYNAYAASGSVGVGYAVQASGIYSIGIGPQAVSFGNYSTAMGWNSSAQNSNSISIGVNSSSLANNAVNIGYNSESSGVNSSALGYNSWGRYDYSTAIGYSATATGTNQVRLGTAAEWVSIPGNLTVSGNISNVVHMGTNQFPNGSDVAFQRYSLSTLATGNNAAVPVNTNIFVEVSGPGGAFTINGIAGGRDGKFLILLNRTGQNMTIAHDSGTDPTAANRIYTLTAADKTVTGASSAMLIYNANVSRWILLYFGQ